MGSSGTLISANEDLQEVLVHTGGGECGGGGEAHGLELRLCTCEAAVMRLIAWGMCA